MCPDEDGLTIARTLSAVEKGCCTFQIIDVTDTDLTIEARVPLGVGYPVKPDSQMKCVAILCMNSRKWSVRLLYYLVNKIIGSCRIFICPNRS